jgi:endonuclease YncB( thermonuclease family)
MYSLFNLCCRHKKYKESKIVDPLDISVHYNFPEEQENIKNIINWNDTIEFTFPITGGQVIKVYDGDTITIAAKMPYKDSPLYRFSVRLNGIDTPEIKGKGVTEEEKEMAKQARDFLESLILHKYVILKNIKNEKYGRILADIYLHDTHINTFLIEERYAVKYDGKTKITPESWLKYKNKI